MPTTSVSLRIDNDLLEQLKKRAELEHRSLSNMIISILDEQDDIIRSNYFKANHDNIAEQIRIASEYLTEDQKEELRKNGFMI